MTVANLEGEVSLVVDGLQSTLPVNSVSQTPLDATLSPVASAGAPRALTEQEVSELAHLPYDLLSRDFTAARMTAGDAEPGVCPV